MFLQEQEAARTAAKSAGTVLRHSFERAPVRGMAKDLGSKESASHRRVAQAVVEEGRVEATIREKRAALGAAASAEPMSRR